MHIKQAVEGEAAEVEEDVEEEVSVAEAVGPEGEVSVAEAVGLEGEVSDVAEVQVEAVEMTEAGVLRVEE